MNEMKKYLIMLPLLTGSLLSFADYDNHDGQVVSYANFSKSSHIWSSWIGVIAERTSFSRVDDKSNYTNSNFKDAKLTYAWCEYGNFSDSNFKNADLTHTYFTGSTLTGADFKGANISSTSFLIAIGFTETQLKDTMNYNKDLSGINFGYLDISSWDFTNQNLSSTSFLAVKANGTNFSNSNLTSSVFETATLEKAYFVGADVSNAKFPLATLTNASFAKANATSADFRYATLTGTYFNYANITLADFSYVTGLTKAKFNTTASYISKDLHGIKLRGNDLTDWNFAKQNLQNSDFTGANVTNVNFDGADLRGSTLTSISGEYKELKNTIFTDGKIKNFSMESSSDNFSIRKYASADVGGEEISAKIAEDAEVLGDSALTLEQGTELEVVDNATLSFGADSSLLINTDKDGSTTFSVESGAGLTFKNGATITLNIVDTNSVLNVDGYRFVIMNWNDDSRITGVDDFVIDSTLFLTLNGISYDKAWCYYIKNNQMFIEVEEVPEPSTYAAIFGVIALGFAVWSRRK